MLMSMSMSMSMRLPLLLPLLLLLPLPLPLQVQVQVQVQALMSLPPAALTRASGMPGLPQLPRGGPDRAGRYRKSRLPASSAMRPSQGLRSSKLSASRLQMPSRLRCHRPCTASSRAARMVLRCRA